MSQSQFFPASDAVSQNRISGGETKYTNTDQIRGYNIGTFEYPDGLRTKPDLQHYVAFYINVRDKSTGGKSNNPDPTYFVSKAEQERINVINNNGSKINQADVEAGINVVKNNAGTLAVAGTVIASIGMGSGLKDIPSVVGKAAAAGIGARVAVKMLDKLNLPPFKSGSTSRIKEVITLHLEDRPSVKYGTNYTDKELGALTGLLVQGSAAASHGTLSKAAPEIQARFISEMIKLPSLKAGGGTLNDLRELGTRERTNPFREVLFESVDYRSFNFRYRFFPKSPSETQRIKDIINMFKVHMHPELTSSKLFYIYPSEFDIQYFYKDTANDYLHKFARCALTDMAVEYGGEQFATFEDGSPVEIGLTLTFRELEQMTSEGIKNNGY